MIKKTFKKLILIFAFLVTFSNAMLVKAQEIIVPGEDIGLDTINFPIFITLNYAYKFADRFSIFSYIGLAVTLIFFVLVAVWVFLLIKASIDIVRSQGNEEMIQSGYKRFGAVFWSITFLIGFVAVFGIVTSFFGLGNFWEWPKVFSVCDNGEYYYQVTLRTQTTGEAADRACFGG